MAKLRRRRSAAGVNQEAWRGSRAAGFWVGLLEGWSSRRVVRKSWVRASSKAREGWELDEEWAEFVAEAGDLIEKGLKEGAGVAELRGVGDGFGEFDGEAEVGWRGGGPALPGFALVRAMEAGVDLDGVEAVGVALEVGEVGVAGWGEVVGVVAGEGPAGGANVDAGGRVVGRGDHGVR